MSSSFDEGAIIRGLDQHLPDGWSVSTPSSLDAGYDMIATSPGGNTFPIEMKSGSGFLDVSAVVDFGSEVEELAEEQAGRVKPLIVTSQIVGQASIDYASAFDVDFIKAGSEDESQAPDLASILRQVADGLKVWDQQLEATKDEPDE